MRYLTNIASVFMRLHEIAYPRLEKNDKKVFADVLEKRVTRQVNSDEKLSNYCVYMFSAITHEFICRRCPI